MNKSKNSLLILAFSDGSHNPTTLLGGEVEGNTISVKCFTPLSQGSQVRLHLCYWTGVVEARARVLEMEERNGSWQGKLAVGA